MKDLSIAVLFTVENNDTLYFNATVEVSLFIESLKVY